MTTLEALRELDRAVREFGRVFLAEFARLRPVAWVLRRFADEIDP